MLEAPKKVLVVEDEEDLRDLLVQTLELDFQVISAANGVAGLEAARLHRPDFILCDYNMPIRNGVQTISEIRRDPLLANLPIILMSGQRQPEESENLGVIFLAKPFPLDTLLHIVTEALKEPQAAAA
jgi:CheY-like chemotaxis protein